ncbi:SAM-dependent methyltransferase [Kineococcus sp. LSe6-4]|uniref:SAM-dependent methyltransferase n=1 Tax=Kineococcus halophytocola TaxID=3234027 RepID=A0ABV4H589_9ACTN
MSELENFDPDWLALREPVDHGTRSARLEELLAARLTGRDRVRVVDLGAGSGSTLRHLAPRLAELGVAAAQDWVLVDHDADLLARALASPVPAAASVTTARVDLADREAVREVLSGADVVVGSALLDVLPAPVADGLVEVLSTLDPRPAVLFVLTVTGGASTDPAVAGAAEGFDADQRARGLGPDAAGHVAAAFTARGWSVQREATPWRLGPSPLLTAWARGWFTAAGVAGPDPTAAVVPHEDLLAL